MSTLFINAWFQVFATYPVLHCTTATLVSQLVTNIHALSAGSIFIGARQAQTLMELVCWVLAGKG
jgi:hypothetical protein